MTNSTVCLLRRLTLTVVVVAFLLMPTSAPASTKILNLDGSPARMYQWWADTARVPTADETIVVSEDTTRCGENLACTGLGTDVIYFGVQSFLDDEREVREAWLHELGHRFDYQMPEWKRSAFRRIMKVKGWRTGANSVHEQFAKAYSYCAIKSSENPYSLADGLGYGYSPSPRQQAQVCRVIRSANTVVAP